MPKICNVTVKLRWVLNIKHIPSLEISQLIVQFNNNFFFSLALCCIICKWIKIDNIGSFGASQQATVAAENSFVYLRKHTWRKKTKYAKGKQNICIISTVSEPFFLTFHFC